MDSILHCWIIGDWDLLGKRIHKHVSTTCGKSMEMWQIFAKSKHNKNVYSKQTQEEVADGIRVP